MKSLLQQATRRFPTVKLTNVGKIVGFNREDKFVSHSNVDVYIKGSKITKIDSNVNETEELVPGKVIDV
jgi:imidazolonepropionase